MDNVFFVGFYVNLVNEAFAAQGKQTAARDERITPVGETLDKLAFYHQEHVEV